MSMVTTTTTETPGSSQFVIMPVRELRAGAIIEHHGAKFHVATIEGDGRLDWMRASSECGGSLILTNPEGYRLAIPKINTVRVYQQGGAL